MSLFCRASAGLIVPGPNAAQAAAAGGVAAGLDDGCDDAERVRGGQLPHPPPCCVDGGQHGGQLLRCGLEEPRRQLTGNRLARFGLAGEGCHFCRCDGAAQAGCQGGDVWLGGRCACGFGQRVRLLASWIKGGRGASSCSLVHPTHTTLNNPSAHPLQGPIYGTPSLNSTSVHNLACSGTEADLSACSFTNTNVSCVNVWGSSPDEQPYHFSVACKGGKRVEGYALLVQAHVLPPRSNGCSGCPYQP